MDKQKIISYQFELLTEIEIVSILGKKQNNLSISDISKQSKSSIPENDIHRALLKLVSYGIINVHFDENNFLYSASEFGKYFYEKMIQNNEQFKEFSSITER